MKRRKNELAVKIVVTCQSNGKLVFLLYSVDSFSVF